MSRVLQILCSILDGLSRKEIHHRWTVERHCRIWLSCMQFAGRITLTYHWTVAWHSPLLLDSATCRCTAARYCQDWPPCVLTHHWLAVRHCQNIPLPASEVETKVILMGHPELSCRVLVARSIFILLIPKYHLEIFVRFTLLRIYYHLINFLIITL